MPPGLPPRPRLAVVLLTLLPTLAPAADWPTAGLKLNFPQ